MPDTAYPRSAEPAFGKIRSLIVRLHWPALRRADRKKKELCFQAQTTKRRLAPPRPTLPPGGRAIFSFCSRLHGVFVRWPFPLRRLFRLGHSARSGNPYATPDPTAALFPNRAAAGRAPNLRWYSALHVQPRIILLGSCLPLSARRSVVRRMLP